MITEMGRTPKFSAEQDTLIASSYADGSTLLQLALEYDVSQTAVRNALLRSGVTLRPRNSPRPVSQWTMCACGDKAVYASGMCHACYDRIRNRDPLVRERKWRWWLMKHHGLTCDDYDQMLEAQDGVCAGCHKPDPRGARLAVDHNHSCCPADKSCSNCRRGLLCVRCNRAVGLLQDSADTATWIAQYLIRFRHD